MRRPQGSLCTNTNIRYGSEDSTRLLETVTVILFLVLHIRKICSNEGMYLLAMPLINGFNISEDHAMTAVPQAVRQRWLGIGILGQGKNDIENMRNIF